MRINTQAGDCAQAAISAEVVSSELAFVRFEIENLFSDRETVFKAVTLTDDQARELAGALLSAADAIDFMRTNESALP